MIIYAKIEGKIINMKEQNLVIKNVDCDNIKEFLKKIDETGTKIEKISKNVLKVYGNKNINPTNIETSPYPGFPTDMQAQWMAFMTMIPSTLTVPVSYLYLPEYQMKRVKRSEWRVQIYIVDQI